MPETQIVAAKEEHKYYPFQGIYYLYRNSFWQAGQDSFTQPPSQNPDMFSLLTNVEPVVQGTLQRRRGYQLLSNQVTVSPYTLSFAYRNDNTAQRDLIFTNSGNVIVIDEHGNNVLNPLFVPSPGATAPRMVLSTNYGYFSDGVQADNFKWDGGTPQGLTNWGININSASSPVGPDYSAAVTDAGTGLGGVTYAWSNVTNAQGAPNGTVATSGPVANSNQSTDYLKAVSYGFSIPSTSTINGIQINVTCDPPPTFKGTVQAQLLKAGTPVGKVLQANVPNFPLQTVNIGGASQLWGANWTFSDINNANFGVRLYFIPSQGSTNVTFAVDAIGITVFSSPLPLTVGAPTSGNVTLLSGRTYFYAFQNSKSGGTSGLSPASASTGPLTNQQEPLSAIPTSTDSQVDNVLILATLDGGDQTTLFLVGTVPNGTATFTDNIPDTQLATSALYQYTDAFSQLHGIANNNVPPAAFFPTKHKGRIYMASGSVLYFSKNLNDVTTANGLITAKYEEAWPATNQLDISQFAESIRGLLSDGETLWIGTERSIRRLIGDSPSNFQNPEIQFNEVGLYNQDVWKIVFYEGQPVGSMWLTPDFRVVSSDFNTYQDVGWPIQDVLNSINQNATVGPHGVFYSKGPSDYFMLFIPTGTNLQPDTACVYNLRTQKWFIWRATDLITTALFLIDGSGNPRWVFAANAGPIYEWIQGSVQDRIGNTPASYPCTIQTSWMNFGDHNLRKALNQMLLTGTNILGTTFALFGALVQQDFNAPNLILPSTSIVTGPLSEEYVALAGLPTSHKYYMLQWSDTSTNVNLMSSYSVETTGLFRY